jgi:signal transduction histidine kinase
MAGRYTVAIDVDLPPGRFGEDCELTAYYVIAESITNAIKHARASRIAVQGARRDGCLLVTITDDGQGGASADAGLASAASSTACAASAGTRSCTARPVRAPRYE